MMTESQALEVLSREDPEAAGEAQNGLAWLTGDEGLETISLLRLQEFSLVRAPGEVADVHTGPGRRGRGPRAACSYSPASTAGTAGVCSSPGTEKIITAYSDRHEDGVAAYSEAIEESNAAPPDTELLA